MKKIFTFTLAILATMSLLASETVTIEWSAAGGQGYCYSQAGPTGGIVLENNAIYFMSATAPAVTTIDGDKYLGPHKLGVVFKPTVDATLSVNIGQNNINRKCTVYVDIVKDTIFDAFADCAGSETKMPNKIYDLYKEDETVLKWWFDNTNKKVIKQSSGNYVAGTDGASMQCLSGEVAPGGSYLTGSREEGSVVASFEAANTFKDFAIDLEGKGDYVFKAGKSYRLYILQNSGGNMALKSLTFTASCEAPASPLVLKASKTVDVVANDEITFSTEGGNGADVTIAGKNGETITANKWTAVKGEHIFTATQDVKDGKCGNAVELKIVVIGTDPVTEAKVTGSDKAKVGKEVTLTCEAEDATSYQWYKNGEKIEGATSETYSFTPDAAGEIIFACEAWNKNNDETHPAVKADFKITVADGDCGVLIKANLTGDKTASVDPNSTIGGTTETNLGKAGKLDKKCYFGVTLADGAFAEGDMFIMNITTAADVEGSLKLYEDKAGSNLIAEITEDINGSGEKKWKLPAAAAGKKSIYVVRGDVTDWNAYFTSIAIKRSCGDESKDASLKYLIVNGDTVKAESNVYNYMVAYASQDLKVTVKYEMNDGGATSSGKKEFEIDVPTAPGDTVPATFTVTAEDGATAIEYTINIIRPVTDDSDATIKALEINKTEVKEKDGVFAYEVPADQKIKTVIVEFVLNNPDAKADKASGFEMDVPAAGDPAKETTINVIAKNGTKKEYKIAVTKAEGGEDEGLEGIQSTEYGIQKIVINGQLFILKNGVLYNATGAVVK